MAAQMVVPQSASKLIKNLFLKILFNYNFLLEPGDAMKSLETAAEAEVQQVAKSKEISILPKSKNSIQFVKYHLFNYKY